VEEMSFKCLVTFWSISESSYALTLSFLGSFQCYKMLCVFFASACILGPSSQLRVLPASAVFRDLEAQPQDSFIHLFYFTEHSYIKTT